MGTDEMSRAHARDYELKSHCDNAAREIEWLLQFSTMRFGGRDVLRSVLQLLRDESAHITRVLD